MKGVRYVVLIASVWLLWSFDDACAGSYDGEWNGSATIASGQCKPADIQLSVADTTALGQARFGVEKQNIYGTVSADGKLGATIGLMHLTGNFSKDMFEGTFKSYNCSWKMILKRIR